MIEINTKDTALLITDPQNDVLESLRGLEPPGPQSLLGMVKRL